MKSHAEKTKNSIHVYALFLLLSCAVLLCPLRNLFAYELGCDVAPDHQDVVYKTVNGLDLKMDIYLPVIDNLKHPLIIYIHGGGWRMGDKNYPNEGIPCFATDEGFVVASINYRLSRDAAFASYKDTIVDVKDAVRFLRLNAVQYGINPSKFGSWGPSAGGHLSAMLATTYGESNLDGCSGECESSKVQAAVASMGPYDFNTWTGLDANGNYWDVDLSLDWWPIFGGIYNPAVDYLGCFRASCPERYLDVSPINHITSDDSPIMVIHGIEDQVVHYSQSQELYAALVNASVYAELALLEGVGHEPSDSQADPGITFLKKFLLCHDADEDGHDTCNAGDYGDDGNPADCDDNSSMVHPGAVEICANGKDDNCDGIIDCPPVLTGGPLRENDLKPLSVNPDNATLLVSGESTVAWAYWSANETCGTGEATVEWGYRPAGLEEAFSWVNAGTIGCFAPWQTCWSSCAPESAMPGDGVYEFALRLTDCEIQATVEKGYYIALDGDGDGVADHADNCPGVCNTQQFDADHDGIGDVCDPSPGCGGCGQPDCEPTCGL